MKKLKKINLKLNKEVVSNLSNDNLNQVKGGTAVYTAGAVTCEFPPYITGNGTTCDSKMDTYCVTQCYNEISNVNDTCRCQAPTAQNCEATKGCARETVGC